MNWCSSVNVIGLPGFAFPMIKAGGGVGLPTRHRTKAVCFLVRRFAAIFALLGHQFAEIHYSCRTSRSTSYFARRCAFTLDIGRPLHPFAGRAIVLHGRQRPSTYARNSFPAKPGAAQLADFSEPARWQGGAADHPPELHRRSRPGPRDNLEIPFSSHRDLPARCVQKLLSMWPHG